MDTLSPEGHVREWLTGYFAKLPKRLIEVTAQHRTPNPRTGLHKHRHDISNIAWSRNATQQRSSIHIFLCFGYPFFTPSGPGFISLGPYFLQSLFNHWALFCKTVTAIVTTPSLGTSSTHQPTIRALSNLGTSNFLM